MRRDNGSRNEFASAPHAAKATRWVFKLARLSPRVRRVYFYHWTCRGPGHLGLRAASDGDGRPRPAYGVVRIVRAPAARASRRRAAAAR